MAIPSDVTKGVVKNLVRYAFLAAQRNDNRVQFPAVSLINLLCNSMPLGAVLGLLCVK